MLDKLTVFADRWYVFVPLLAAAVLSYLLERFLKNKKAKLAAGIAGVVINAALVILAIVFGASAELTLLMLLASLLAALLI